jgi:sugar phosphate permease
LAARLIAPVVEEKGDWVAGYKWVMDQLRPDYEVCGVCGVLLCMYVKDYLYAGVRMHLSVDALVAVLEILIILVFLLHYIRTKCPFSS